jgi:alkylation response protein AidB-like acyl-CoA dehydrogenase
MRFFTLWNAQERKTMLKIADEMGPVSMNTVDDRNERSTRTLNAVRELAPKIRAASDEIEQGRRLPLHLVEQMQRAGVFRMAMPRAWGGPELNVLSQLRVIEALSIGDASAGWCAMIGNDGGSVSALFDWRGNWQPVFSVAISTKM